MPSRLRFAPRSFCAPLLGSCFTFFFGCADAELSTEEQAQLATFELDASALPSSPTNRFADDAAAAALGQKLFFDRGLSADGTVACVDCHDPDAGFSDARRRSLGVGGQAGKRHAMPIGSAALQSFLLWDGRADTVWRQPLFALENPLEMSFSRSEVAHHVAATHAQAYEAVFGPLPSLDDVPARAQPGDAAWDALTDARRDDVQRIFVNVGKAIEAYERQLVCANTRFDRWTRGEIELTDDERAGAATFVRSGCDGCHDGSAFSDGAFHNLGLSSAAAAEPDRGREDGVAAIVADPLNGASTYSDDPAAGAARIAAATNEDATRGAFRTASLRGVTQRDRFGHLGDHRSLAAFIEDTYRRRGGRGARGDGDGDGDGDGGFIGALDPLLDDVAVGGDDDVDAIVAFLGTLACPDVADALLVP